MIISDLFEFTLDAIQFVDQVQRDIGSPGLTLGLHFLRIDELTSRMCPAAQTLDTWLRAQGVIAGVIVGHQVAAIIGKQAQRHLLRSAGGVVKQDNWARRRAAGLDPHPGLTGRVSIRLLQHLYPRFVAVDHRTFQ